MILIKLNHSDNVAGIVISRETREAIRSSVAEDKLPPPWQFPFIFSNKQFYDELVALAVEVKNQMYLRELDAITQRANLERKHRLALEEQLVLERQQSCAPKQRTSPNKGKQYRKRSKRGLPRTRIPSVPRTREDPLEAYVAAMVAKGHKCTKPSCKNVVPWDHSFCPNCITQNIRRNPSLASFGGTHRCKGCGLATAMIGEGLCRDCLGKGR